MPSPFPGMDPYIEQPAIWADFHDSLIIAIRAQLQPQLRPRYVAITQERLYVVESERPIYPDVAILRTGTAPLSSGGTVVLEPDAPAVFDLWREEVRQPVIHIIEPAAGNRVVSAIEVLGPDNKRPGPGRENYEQKREELWEAGVNLIEIDLLREGELSVRVSEDRLMSVRPWSYIVAVTRSYPTRHELYPNLLQRGLPRVAIPLGTQEKDVILDLRIAFTRCWDEGPYPALLRYEGPPPGRMSPEEIRWCEQQLIAAGFRAASAS